MQKKGGKFFEVAHGGTIINAELRRIAAAKPHAYTKRRSKGDDKNDAGRITAACIILTFAKVKKKVLIQNLIKSITS